MNFSDIEPFSINVVDFTMMERLSNGIVFVEVEGKRFGTKSFDIPTIHLAIEFYDRVLSNSRHTLQKMAIDVMFPLSASAIAFATELRQLFVRCKNRTKYATRQVEMGLLYPYDIHSNSIKYIEEIKTLSTLALLTNATFSLDEILSLRVKRLEINQRLLTENNLNVFIRQWFIGNLEFQEFTFLGVDLYRELSISLLFEGLDYQRSDHFEESMQDALSKYKTKRHVAFYRIKSLDEKRTMKVKLTCKRLELEMF